MSDFDHENPACIRTYSTLRIYTGARNPDEISELLSIEPSRIWYVEGAGAGRGKPVNAWYLTSKGRVDSQDTREHINALIEVIASSNKLVELIESGSLTVDIMSFWHSSGQGGPSLKPEQMKRLGAWGVPVLWNVYFQG